MIDSGRGRPARCQTPVAWHGVLSSGDGGRYRVCSCDAHAGYLDDRKPVTRRIDAVNTTTDRVVMLSWK
jgi:hypothetical protein